MISVVGVSKLYGPLQVLQDVSLDGRVLVSRTYDFHQHFAQMPGEAQERSLSLPDQTMIVDFAPDGKNLVYSGVIEDPVYLAKPVEWTGKWEYRPTMAQSNEKCDLEVARKFLRDF